MRYYEQEEKGIGIEKILKPLNKIIKEYIDDKEARVNNFFPQWYSKQLESRGSKIIFQISLSLHVIKYIYDDFPRNKVKKKHKYTS